VKTRIHRNTVERSSLKRPRRRFRYNTKVQEDIDVKLKVMLPEIERIFS
jgi:hypothetical protein